MPFFDAMVLKCNALWWACIKINILTTKAKHLDKEYVLKCYSNVKFLPELKNEG